MIVADTSAVISLATADALSIVVEEFDVHTTDLVLGELADTAGYDDEPGRAAEHALDLRDRLTVHDVTRPGIESSRIDAGEASCTVLVRDVDAGFLVTDDLRALPELQAVVDAEVVISPFVLKALVERNALERGEAVSRIDDLAETRNWLGAPIYRRARNLFDED